MTNIEMDKRLFEWVNPTKPGLTVDDVLFALTADRELREAFLSSLGESVAVYEAEIAESSDFEHYAAAWNYED